MGTIADYSISPQNGKRHRMVEIRGARGPQIREICDP